MWWPSELARRDRDLDARSETATQDAPEYEHAR
jgi:hypothetical protein